MTGGTTVELERVTLDRGAAAPALAELSCTIPAGQFCAILGASGAGKSSLLRVAGGMIAPSAGTVRLDGAVLACPPLRAVSRTIGQVHQDFALVDEASVAANILAGAAAAMPLWRILTGLHPLWARDRAMALTHALGLAPEHLAQPVGLLSGGQQQRVGIARALMLDPSLVLADEPVASVDPATARTVMQVLAGHRARTGATILCTLHQPEIACAFADRILVLDAGRLVFDGTPAQYPGTLVRGIAA